MNAEAITNHMQEMDKLINDASALLVKLNDIIENTNDDTTGLEILSDELTEKKTQAEILLDNIDEIEETKNSLKGCIEEATNELNDLDVK